METESITWNPVSQVSCSTKELSYLITVIPLPQDSSPDKFYTTFNRADLPAVQHNTTYVVFVKTIVDSDQLQSETASTLTFTTGDQPSQSKVNSVRL